MMNATRLAGVAACALTLSACGGGGGTAVAPAALATTASTTSGQTVRVTFSIVVPRAGAAATRKAQYISTGTTTASIKVNAGTAQTGACTSGTCVVTIDAPIGSDTFVVQLLDGSSNVLSEGSTTATILPTAANVVSVAFGGVPKTAVISAATTNLVPGTLASTSAISVVVKDASGATIVGSDLYVTATGAANPIALTDSDGTQTSLTTTSLTSPATSTSTLNYTGNGSLAGATLTIGATAIGLTPTPATVNIYAHHTILEYPIITPGAYALSITTGPDGNIWFAEQNGNHVGRVTPAGVVTEFPLTVNGQLDGIAPGPDGNVWFTDFSNTAVEKITPGGTITRYTSGLSANSSPNKIIQGPSNDLYFGEFGSYNPGRIGRITTAGVVTESAQVSGNPQIQGVTIGSDGRLWFTEPFGGTNQIGAMTIPAFGLSLYSISGGSQLRDLASGPDGNIWFTDTGQNKVGRIQTDGTAFTEFTIPTGSSVPLGITSGSDGHLYFVELDGNNVAQVTVGGAITEWPIPTAGSQPYAGTNGPDGNYWFVESNGNNVGRFIL